MKHVFAVGLILLALGAFSGAWAAEAPTEGLLYNVEEDHSLSYSCTQKSDLLECSFTQVSVRKKAKPEELEEKLEEAKRQFPAILEMLNTDPQCNIQKNFRDFAAVLKGRKEPDESQKVGLAQVTESQKEDIIKFSDAIENLCRAKTQESYLALTRLADEKNLQTCAISSNSFKQNFRWAAKENPEEGTWVVESKADGPCGIVLLDRFEPERVDEKTIYWKYVAQKQITKPEEKWLQDNKCSDMDQSEYVYDWKPNREYKLGCEYIEFSPF